MRSPSRDLGVDLEPVARVEGQDLGAGAGLEAGGAGRVVGVGVGADDPADAIAAAADDGVEVGVVVGPGVDHGDLVDADEVGVGAGAGHDAGVGGDDAPDQRAEGPGDAGHQRLGRRRLGVGIDDLRRLSDAASGLLPRVGLGPAAR